MTMRNSSLNSLHNEFRPVAIELYERMVRSHQSGFVKYRFDIFETLRSFDRQNDLFAKGVTKARAGDSAQNFGFAIDLVPFLTSQQAAALGVRTGWYWPEIADPAWKVLQETAAALNLKTISWDKPHAEHASWKTMKR